MNIIWFTAEQHSWTFHSQQNELLSWLTNDNFEERTANGVAPINDVQKGVVNN